MDKNDKALFWKRWSKINDETKGWVPISTFITKEHAEEIKDFIDDTELPFTASDVIALALQYWLDS